MKKAFIPIAFLIIAVLLSTLACAAAAPSELKPCTVELGYVSNEWAGEEVIAASVFLTVKNPNPVPVTLESIDYKITVNKTEVGMKTLVPRILIPAMGSVGLSNINIIDFSSSLAVQQIYIGQGKDYVTAHVMAASLWKLLGGKKPSFWSYPAAGIYAGIMSGPALADVKAGTADNTAISAVYGKIRGAAELFQGNLDKAWTAAPDGPCIYNVAGKANISYGTMSKDTAFDLKYERK